MVALFVIATFITFLFIDYLIHRKTKSVSVAQQVRSAEQFVIPRGFFFSPKHMWLELLGNGEARIGLDDFVQKIVGFVDEVRIVPVNSTVKRGETILTLKQNGRSLSVAAPVSGRVLETNDLLLKSPELIRQDPYMAGWVATIQPEQFSTEVGRLNIAEGAAAWLRDEVSRFRDFINAHTPQLATGVTLLDGGIPTQGVLQGAEETVWTSFEREFLSASPEQKT
jgi:glycine cleavage system H protein